jgi:hypothetical protein
MLSQHRSKFRKLSKHFTHAECELKNVLRMLSMRKKCDTHAEHAVKNVLRMMSMREQNAYAC